MRLGVKVRSLLLTIGCVALLSAGVVLNWHAPGNSNAAVPRINFSQDIRPILNQNCTSCHGGVRQKNGVSFIYREEALGKGKSGRPVIVPGHPEKSELIKRLVSTDPEARMPYHAPALPSAQIALLRQWIKEGASWEDHWAFVAPKAQALPPVKDSHWPRQPFDRFVLATLRREGLEPSPEAGKTALLRRVSFDLIGLPPTPEELAAFLADPSGDAYEKQVDRLLASPRYGERWAALWLDLARYADSRGYESDVKRTAWPYRDWVIDAFNQNLPYDQFVIKQLAGDLLPNATYEDRIATSFQRQTPANDEGGTDDEEFRLVAVMDRAATTWSVLNGVTINCVQCHSHPYDPIRHAEYYKFLAFYNTSRDADLSFNDYPTLAVPKDASQRSDVAHLSEDKAALLRDVVTVSRQLDAQTSWKSLAVTSGVVDEVPALESLLADTQLALHEMRPLAPSLDDIPAPKLRKDYQELITDTTKKLDQARSSAKKIPLGVDHGEAMAPDTLAAQSAFELQTEAISSVITALRVEVPPVDAAKARHTPENGFIIDHFDAWIVPPGGHEEKVEFRFFAPDSEQNLEAAIERAARRVDRPGSDAAPITEGTFAANSKLFQTRWMVAVPATPLKLMPGSTLRLQLIQTQRIDSKPAIAKRIKVTATADERWTALSHDEVLIGKTRTLLDLQRRLSRITTVPLPVMAEQASYEQRHTLEFERGNFLTKIGPVLSPDVPGLFPKLPVDLPHNRLTMAKWFFEPGQPLTSRVAVNRYWEQLFGTGIVETLEDFGSSGQPPSDPPLLDWLALHFQNDLHWDMKLLLRELVCSATYRQDSKVSSSLLEKDPRNRLLARGPLQRLTSEMVRDQALLASGLLSTRMGGPPVMPPQPDGVWMTVYNDSRWVDATGADRHRRAIYTYLKRSALYPSFATFDAADHIVSLARRIPTNTPLQALVTLNDPVYHEAAEALAQHMLHVDTVARTRDEALKDRLNEGARRVLSRDLAPGEMAALQAFYGDLRKTMPDRTAFASIATVLLNLDPALTR